MGQGLSLLCQAQGFPMPYFRYLNILYVLFIYYKCNLTEPIGSRAPKLQADSKLKQVERESNSEVSLFCLAQGYPVPSYR